jgi:ribose/xylose/arabinose/galactoside ABC-type transport system permease subunit
MTGEGKNPFPKTIRLDQGIESHDRSTLKRLRFGFDGLRCLSVPGLRPFLVFVVVLAGLAFVDAGGGRILTGVTVFSTLQSFSTFGPAALGLGLTMVIGEFDLSISGVFGLGGCVAVLYGNDSAWLGIACALGIGILFGVAQGLIITRFAIGSVPVTLGGLLTANGLAYVLTMNRTVSFDHIDLALALNEPIAGVLSIRSLVALAIFAIAIFIFVTTRIGRDLIATGSNRRAALISGVGVGRIIVLSFAFSSTMSALGGALLSYGLASASPAGLADVLVPAITAAILGGVSLSGGVGSPLGLAAGVITLSLLRSGLNALGAPPFINDVALGLILLVVAIADAPYLLRRLGAARGWWRRA